MVSLSFKSMSFCSHTRWVSRAVLVLWVCAILPASWAQEVDVQVQDHFVAARNDQQLNLLDAAVHEYKTILQLRPGLAEAYANLGLIYYAQSRFAESASALSTAGRLKPGLEGATLWLGVDYIKLGQPQKAVPLLREVVRRTPSDEQAQKWLGTALWNSGETLPALEQLTRTSEHFPADVDSSFVLGEALRKAANQQMEGILAAASGTPLLHQIYGDIYKDQHAWTRSAAHYKLASREDPAWIGAHLGLGEVYLYQEKWTEAASEFHSELKIDPSSSAATAHLSEIELLTGNLQGALDLLGVALRTSPYHTAAALELTASSRDSQPPLSDDALANLERARGELQTMAPSAGRSLALLIIDHRLKPTRAGVDFKEFQGEVKINATSRSRYDVALDDIDRGQLADSELNLRSWLTLHPNDLKARYLLARTLQGLSLKALDHLISLDPTSYRVHQLLGQTYEDRQEDAKALAEYRVADQMNPSLPGVHFEIGHLLWQFGDRTNALDELNKELKLNPDHAEANGEVGSILLIQNQPAEAIPYLQRALRIQPNLSLIHRQLGKAYMQQNNYAKAEQELKIADRNDLDGTAHYQLGYLYRMEGKTEAASKEFDESRRIKAERIDEAQVSAREVPAS